MNIAHLIKTNTDNITYTLFLSLKVLILVPLAHALYSAANDYWPLDEISYSRVYNWRNWNWKARVKGTIITGAWRPLRKYPRAHLRNW